MSREEKLERRQLCRPLNDLEQRLLSSQEGGESVVRARVAEVLQLVGGVVDDARDVRIVGELGDLASVVGAEQETGRDSPSSRLWTDMRVLGAPIVSRSAS